MIDISLIEEPVNLNDYKSYDEGMPKLFLGYVIKNEYDNQRLQLNDKLNPKKRSYVYKDKLGLNVLPLYGLFFNLNETGISISNALVRQKNADNINLVVYENILEQYDFSCNDCYGYFDKNIFPVDFKYFDKLTDDNIALDKKILQKLLSLNENKFDFQKFGSIITLILT
jgi:hypothetical protein|tara:strand:- start:79 stop:588 length:510 start_codon:yes stop_codon:yes gene_type:complete